MNSIFTKIYHWLFTSEERKFIPDLFMNVCFSIGISWFVCSFMLNSRDLLFDKYTTASQITDVQLIDYVALLTDKVIEIEDYLENEDPGNMLYKRAPVEMDRDYLNKLEVWEPEPCCSIHEQELNRLSESQLPELCQPISSLDRGFVLPGLPITVGDVYHEMCKE